MQRFGGEIDRIVRRNRIQFSCSRPGSPDVLIPAVTQNPLSGFGFPGPLFHAAQTFFFCSGFTVNLLQAEGIMLQMQMSISETRHNEAPAHVLLLGIWILWQKIISLSNRDNPFA